MNRYLVLVALAGVLLVFNFSVLQKEKMLEEGERVYVELAPVDPRSLIQGDYMALEFQVATAAAEAIPREVKRGRLVVRRNEQGIVSFLRLHTGDDLAEDERLMRFKRDQGLWIGARSWFFQEGRAQHFEKARYGVFVLSSDGETLLAGMCDEHLELL